MTEEPLTGGFSNVVARSGDTVRRGVGPWTPTVHALLHHLADVGFSYSPRVLGIDGQGREMLSYIDGSTAWWPWPPALLADEGLRAVGRMIRELTQAVATFVEPPDALWHSGARAGGVIRHGDLAPWHTVWDGNLRPASVV